MMSSSQGRQVLLVEDDSDYRTMMRCFLEAGNWNVTEASNGLEALRHMAEASPDLMITDIDMPALNGIGLINKLRESTQWSTLPIIIVTGNTLSIDFFLTLTEFVITKPADKTKLLNYADAAMARKITT